MIDDVYEQIKERISTGYNLDDNDKDVDRGSNTLSGREKYLLHKRAYADAFYQHYKGIYARQMSQDFLNTGQLPYEPEDIECKALIDRARNAVISKPPYAFITINPYDVITLDELQKYVNKYKKRKFIDSYYYVYEVRKKDHTGLHCHMLIKYNCKPYDLKRNTQNTFKNVCDDSNPCVLNIKYIEQDILQSKITYMNGDKKESKKEGVLATKEYRIENGLPAYFESTPSLPCRGAEYLSNALEPS